MVLARKTGQMWLILVFLAAVSGCGVQVQVTPQLVGKQAPPQILPTDLPEKEVRLVTETPQAAQPAQTKSAQAQPENGREISPENAAQLTSTALQVPEYIETLLWPRPDLLMAVSTGSTAYPVQLEAPSVGAPVQWQMPENGGPIAFTSDGSRIAVLNGSGMVGVFTPQPDGTLSPVGDVLMAANTASFSADGKTLLLTDPAKTALTLFNVENGVPLKQLSGFAEGDRIYTALLSPDGKTVAWRSRGALQFQDAVTGALGPLVKTQGMIIEARFAPDSRSLAVIVGEHLEAYSAADGKQITRQQLSQPARSFAYTPDGRLLAASYGNSIQLWDTAAWLPLSPLTGHAAPVVKVSFSPDGKTLASADENGELRLWKLP